MTNKGMRKAKPRNGGYMKEAEYVCSITDPFCTHAEGAVDPIGSRQFTVPYQIRGKTISGNSGTGLAVNVIRPGASSTNLYGLAEATTTMTAAAAYTVSTGAHPSFVSQTRVVSAGIRWWTVIAATAAGGSITVVPIPDDRDVLDGAAHTFASLANSPDVQFVDVKKPGSYIFSRTDVPLSHEFLDVNTSGSPADNGWDAVALLFEGPASVNQVVIEWYFNYEGLIDTSQSLRIGAQRPSVPGGAMANSLAVTGYLAGNREQVLQMLKQQGMRIAKYVGKRALAYGANMMLPGSGNALLLADQAYSNAIEVD